MMGQQCRSESLFYYFRIEDHVPENHLLRAIDRYVSFDFVREKLKPLYSDTGRPSIDPERLLRILLIGYLFGVTSERKLIEELRMHLAWRWFNGADVRPRGSASLNVFEEPARKISGIEDLRGAVPGNCPAMRRMWPGAGRAPIGRRKLCPGRCEQCQPDISRETQRSGSGKSKCAAISG